MLPLSTNGMLVFTGGSLPEPLTNRVALTGTNTVIPIEGADLATTIARTNGFFKGTLALPASSTPLKFQGAILHGQTNGAGFFKHEGQVGHVHFGAAP